MSDVTIFEERLRAALRRHVGGGRRDFDALGFARMVVAAEPRRHGLARRLQWRRDSSASVAWRRSSAPALLWPLVALLLIASLLAGALVAGALLRPLQWHRIDLPGLGGQINDVVATDDGYLAVGTGLGPGPQHPETGMVWSSHDGQAWDVVASGGELMGAGLGGVARRGAEFVVVGTRWASDWLDPASPDYRSSSPTGWSSADGRSWRQVQVATGAGMLEDVACQSKRCVAVGWDLGGARIWWSDDASHWAKARQFIGDQPGFVPRLVSVVASRPGFVAAGTTDEGPIWTSVDGDVWQKVELAGGVVPPQDWVQSLVVGADGRLVGLDAAAVVTRGPGKDNWISSALPGPTGEAVGSRSLGVFAEAVTATGWGYVAVGKTVDPFAGGLLWTSVDGVRWSLHDTGPIFDGIDLQRVFRCGDALLVVGSDTGGTYSTWVAPEAGRSEGGIP